MLKYRKKTQNSKNERRQIRLNLWEKKTLRDLLIQINIGVIGLEGGLAFFIAILTSYMEKILHFKTKQRKKAKTINSANKVTATVACEFICNFYLEKRQTINASLRQQLCDEIKKKDSFGKEKNQKKAVSMSKIIKFRFEDIQHLFTRLEK